MLLEPFLKSKYSKKLLVQEIVSHFPKRYGRFVDASTTDAAVFAAQPRSSKRSVLATTNTQLMPLLTALQDQPEQVIREAKELWEDLSREEFESIAASDLPSTGPEAAAQALYLNQLSQPGTMRYDASHRADKFSWELLQDWANALSGVKLLNEDPISRLDNARATDLVYLDTAAGIHLDTALQVSAQSHCSVVLIDSAGLSPKPAEVPDELTSVPLSRYRPGMSTKDTLFIKP